MEYDSLKLLQLRTKDMKAVLEYPKEEEHEEVDLTELIKDGQIALSKLLCTRKLAFCWFAPLA